MIETSLVSLEDSTSKSPTFVVLAQCQNYLREVIEAQTLLKTIADVLSDQEILEHDMAGEFARVCSGPKTGQDAVGAWCENRAFEGDDDVLAKVPPVVFREPGSRDAARHSTSPTRLRPCFSTTSSRALTRIGPTKALPCS